MTRRHSSHANRADRPRGRRRWWRRLLLVACGAAAVSALAFGLPAYFAFSAFPSLIYDDLASLPPAPVAIVFGAGLTRDGQPTPMLADRVDAAVALYRAGKVSRLLMTGDNSRPDHDEVTAMKRQAVAMGVPAERVNLDYAGFRTYDSCYRARAIFGIDSAILVTQRYHLSRALYLANRLGIKAVGWVAGLESYPNQGLYDLREAAALALSWYEVNLLHPRPRFLGPPVDLDHQDASELRNGNG